MTTPSGAASRSIRETVSWNAAGPVLAHPQRLAVEHRLSTGSRRTAADDPGQRVGDVVEVARVDPHLVAAAVDLDANPVELPLDRRELEAPRPPRATVSAVDASIGSTGRKSSKPTSRSPVLAVGRARASPSAAGRPRASARGARPSPGTSAAFATASPISPASAPCRSSPVSRRRTKSASRRWSGGAGRPAPRAAPRPSPFPVAAWTAVDRRVEVGDRERRHGRRLGSRSRRPSRSRSRRGPVAAPGEEADDDRHLLRVEAPQQPGDRGDLPRARARRARPP